MRWLQFEYNDITAMWVTVQVPLSWVLWVGNRVTLEYEVVHYKEETQWKDFSSQAVRDEESKD